MSLNIKLIETGLKELSRLLEKANLKSSIYICGGASLILRNIRSTAVTHDIDFVLPKGDEDLAELINTVAKNIDGLVENWLNPFCQAFNLEQALPKGWQLRSTLEKSYPSLEIYVLDNEDILFLKILAEINREEDFTDIKDLTKGNAELFEKIAKQVMLLPDQFFQVNFKEVILNELRIKLGFGG